ncbi:large ribosomal subunit protein eL39-like [Saccopteryx leptura]|uniref:large ribosomal subunit protein eL39-like n=1 Tax=Saccopteryx leptura TaxID=249018 RepID=UPI00339C9DF4
MSFHKTFSIKRFQTKKEKQKHSIPQWIRMKNEGRNVRYNCKRRNWRRTKLGLEEIAHEMAHILMLNPNCLHLIRSLEISLLSG